MLIDSHCHLDRLDLTKYNNNFEKALEAAYNVNVKYFLCAGIDLENSQTILQLAKQHNNIVISVGLHPTEEAFSLPTEDQLCRLADDPLVVAIGETGLDYYRCPDDKNIQKYQQDLFRVHISAARKMQKPLIIHSRMAEKDMFRILEEENAASVGGVFHCFTESWENAEKALLLNFYVSFSGIITFKNADSLREVAKKIPLDKILIETDSPYLAPIPFRGKPNEPSYLPYVAKSLAKLRELNEATIAQYTSSNFCKLFGIKNLPVFNV